MKKDKEKSIYSKKQIFFLILPLMISYYLIVPFIFLLGLSITVMIMWLGGTEIYSLQDLYQGLENIFGENNFNNKKENILFQWMKIMHIYGIIFVVTSLAFDLLLLRLEKLKSITFSLRKYKLKYPIIAASTVWLLIITVPLLMSKPGGILGIIDFLRATLFICFLALVAFTGAKWNYHLHDKHNK